MLVSGSVHRKKKNCTKKTNQLTSNIIHSPMDSLILLVFHWFLGEVFQLVLPFAIVEVTAQPLPAHQVCGFKHAKFMKFTRLLGRVKRCQARYLDEISRKCSLQTSYSLHLFASPSPHLSQPWASRDLSDAADAVADHPKGMEFFPPRSKSH